MLDRPEFERWRREADRALESATVQADAGLHNWSCFAAEQAAQLAMKALLHGVGDGPWGHDLVELGRRAADSTADLWDDELEARLLRLSRHYIPARYPDAHAGASPGEHYGAEDSKQAVADARGVLGWVDETWRVLVTASEEE